VGKQSADGALVNPRLLIACAAERLAAAMIVCSEWPASGRVPVVQKRLAIAVVGGAMLAGGLMGSGSAWSQKAPRTCADAYRACSGQSAVVPKACDEQKRWCLTTGSFEDPKTKGVHLNLLKK
jgi:hypothetical protein